MKRVVRDIGKYLGVVTMALLATSCINLLGLISGVGNGTNGSSNVTGVTLSSHALSIAEGQTVQLQATVSPTNANDKSVTWRSTDTTVAAVDHSGVVTGIHPGTSTIIVTTNDQSLTDVCNITVYLGGTVTVTTR